jgi:hypothetical protein
LQIANLDQNVIDTRLPKSSTFLKAGTILALAFGFFGPVNVAAATDDASANDDKIQKALSGRTAFEAGKTYRPWRQYFAADGTTVYFGDGPSSIGRWEVRGNQYCSLWPPVAEWECYDVFLDMFDRNIIWFPKAGSPISADLFDGDQTALRSAPKR